MQPSLIWSGGNVFADKATNKCFNCSIHCGNSFCRESVKFVLTTLKRNISPLELQTNVSVRAHIILGAKSPAILCDKNPPQARFSLVKMASDFSAKSQRNHFATKLYWILTWIIFTLIKSLKMNKILTAISQYYWEWNYCSWNFHIKLG